MKNLKLSIVTFTFLLVLFSCREEQVNMQDRNNPFLVEENARPLVIAHRGGTQFYPENTFLAFKYSQDIQADVLELDVHITADNQLVVCHDNTIDRTSDGSGIIHQMTYNELLNYNFGYYFEDENGAYPYRNDPVEIPLLETIFQAFSEELMIVEIKDLGGIGKRCVDELTRLIELYDMHDKVAVFSFDQTITNYYNQKNQSNSFAGGSVNYVIDFILDAFNDDFNQKNYTFDILAIPLSLVGISLDTDHPKIINAANRNNVSVCYWTINDEPTMRRLVNSGVDGIITDRPEKLQEVLEEMGF